MRPVRISRGRGEQIGGTGMSQQLELQPGPEDGIDAPLIAGNSADANFGDHTIAFIGASGLAKSLTVHRLLMRFDLGAIPADAWISSAVLTLVADFVQVE